MQPNETVLDLYSGMGGLSVGFNPYFTVLDAVDLWKDACQTYRLNHTQTKVHITTVNEYLDRCIPKDYEGMLFHGVVGGPPCQEFSILNQSPDLHSARANQLFVFVEAVQRLKPMFAMIENVATLPKELKERAADLLRKAGYNVIHKQIHAYDYGSVQLRRRWILTASKKRHIFPNPAPNTRTAQDILRDKPSYMKMSPEISKQLKLLPKGKWVPLPGKHWKEYFIVDPQKPLPAIVNVLKNRIVRPDRNGYVSLEEIKLAQGFPEAYQMYGGLTSQAQQLANAVPTELAHAFAQAFYRHFHPDRSSLLQYL